MCVCVRACVHVCACVYGVCYNQALHKSIEDGLPRKFADCVFVSSVINKRSFELLCVWIYRRSVFLSYGKTEWCTLCVYPVKLSKLHSVVFSGKIFTIMNQSHRQQCMHTAIHLLQIPVPESPVKCRLLCLYALHGFSKLKTSKGAQLRATSGRPCVFVVWFNNSHTHTHSHVIFPPYIFIQNRTTFLWHIVYCYMTVTTRQGTNN